MAMIILNFPHACTHMPVVVTPEYEKCFCENCSSERNDCEVVEAGYPPKRFVVPLGFAKFGVR